MEKTLDLIKQRLSTNFSPEVLEVADDSEKHKHHEGAKAGGGHYHLLIKAKCFNDQSLVSAHRMIYKALDDLMGKRIHALSIKILKDEKTS